MAILPKPPGLGAPGPPKDGAPGIGGVPSAPPPAAPGAPTNAGGAPTSATRFSLPTSDESHPLHKTIEKDTVVGNYVWIGDKVFIKEGITIGDNAIIGANSVVIEDVKAFEIVAGIPARHIRFNVAHYKYSDNA